MSAASFYNQNAIAERSAARQESLPKRRQQREPEGGGVALGRAERKIKRLELQLEQPAEPAAQAVVSKE